MTKAPTTGWNPEQELARTLDALAEEILATQDREIAAWLHDKRTGAKDAAQEMRRLVAAAECHLPAPPVGAFIDRAFTTRVQ